MNIKQILTKTLSMPRWVWLIIIVILLSVGYYVGQHLSIMIDISTTWR